MEDPRREEKEREARWHMLGRPLLREMATITVLGGRRPSFKDFLATTVSYLPIFSEAVREMIVHQAELTRAIEARKAETASRIVGLDLGEFNLTTGPNGETIARSIN